MIMNQGFKNLIKAENCFRKRMKI